MPKNNKKITLEGLANKVDSLASTMQADFKRMDAKIDTGFKEVNEDIESLARMVASGFEHTASKDDVIRLEQSQEDIKLRLDFVAPQFEVHQLERRVKRLEDRAGIRHRS